MLGIFAHGQIAAGDNLISPVLLAVERWRHGRGPADVRRELRLVHARLHRVVEIHADLALRELGAQRVDVERFGAGQHAAVRFDLMQRLQHFFIHGKIELAGLEVEALVARAQRYNRICDPLIAAGALEVAGKPVSAGILARFRDLFGILDHFRERCWRPGDPRFFKKINVIDQSPELADIRQRVDFSADPIFLFD